MMYRYNSKNQINSQAAKKSIANCLLKQPNPKPNENLNSIESSPSANFQTISAFYLKQKHKSIQTKHNNLTNPMINIGLIKSLNQGPYLNHSTSKILKPLSNSNASLINDEALKFSESSMNLFNYNFKEVNAKDTLDQGLKNNFKQSKIKLKQILTTNASPDCSIIKENSETSPNNKAVNQKQNQTQNQKYNTLSNALSIQLQKNKARKHHKTNSLYIATRKDNEYILRAFNSGSNNYNSNKLQYHSSSRVDCIGNSNSNSNNSKSNNDTDMNNNQNSQVLLPLSESKSLGKIMHKLNKDYSSFGSKARKYNFIKTIFEELIARYPLNQQDAFKKIIIAYHEIVNSYSKDNRKLKEVSEMNDKSKFDCIILILNAIENKLIESKVEALSKVLEKKDIEIEFLRKRLVEYEKKNNFMSFSKSTAASPQCIQNFREVNGEEAIDNTRINNYFLKMKQKNIEYLDSLYFFDKVLNGSNLVSRQSIPLLKLVQENTKKTSEVNNNINILNNNNNNNQKLKLKRSKTKMIEKELNIFIKDNNSIIKNQWNKNTNPK